MWISSEAIGQYAVSGIERPSADAFQEELAKHFMLQLLETKLW